MSAELVGLGLPEELVENKMAEGPNAAASEKKKGKPRKMSAEMIDIFGKMEKKKAEPAPGDEDV